MACPRCMEASGLCEWCEAYLTREAGVATCRCGWKIEFDNIWCQWNHVRKTRKHERECRFPEPESRGKQGVKDGE